MIPGYRAKLKIRVYMSIQKTGINYKITRATRRNKKSSRKLEEEGLRIETPSNTKCNQVLFLSPPPKKHFGS